jgi:hypothetical protein
MSNAGLPRTNPGLVMQGRRGRCSGGLLLADSIIVDQSGEPAAQTGIVRDRQAFKQALQEESVVPGHGGMAIPRQRDQ